MPFTIAPAIFDRFPGLRVAVAVASGVDNATPRPAIDDRWSAAWAEAEAAAARYPNAQSHPRLAPWRERFRAIGVSAKHFPVSTEAMLRRALRGGEPFRINPLVDFYNAVSLRHTVPAGGFDLDQLAADAIELRLSRADERFLALGAEQPEPVAAGEISYIAGDDILTRHFVWRQARRGALTPATRTLFLVSEVLGEVEAEGGGAVADAVLADLCAGLRDHFGVEPRPFILDAANPSCAW